MTRITWQDEGEIQTFTFDAVVSEATSHTSAVTDHPVEQGTDISDHIRANPLVIQVEGVVTNTPIVTPPDNIDGTREITREIQGAQPTIGSAIGRPVPVVGALLANVPLPIEPSVARVRAWDLPFNRTQRFLAAFEFVRSRGLLVTLHSSTATEPYERMAITSLSFLRSASTANALHFSMELKQVRIGVTETVPVPQIPAERTKKGAKVPKPPTPEPVSERASVLRSLFGDS